jgi:hypothetical protein
LFLNLHAIKIKIHNSVPLTPIKTIKEFLPAVKSDADPDPDPAFHFDAVPDPDPCFQIKAQNLEIVLK